ncbi:CBS domain containing protein [Desulfarculus baarsii DSM 2075]|uniref:CBS domain containing protein n=1 Tax=Desulfarculus baarsii (strain ATCC 33931 / DSM 2075 / LMG 7858 / VKM B-1802 / 2st14) TaxID=644282 RepID=E1QIK0_DESB2|nr:CBS domain containing protein [Desulfarculus baarsii DSM 2075]
MDPDSRRSFIERLRGKLGLTRQSAPQQLEREIAGLVDQGEAQGFISADEGEMIEAVLDLAETTAGQIMVPRIDIATVAESASVEEAIRVIIESGHSRIPLHGADLDHIHGIVHAKDLLPFWGRPSEEVNLLRICRKPFFVPLSMSVNRLMAEFRKRRAHLAVVVDEYGGTAGIVTMEDVLEEIVGEIVDEYDQEQPMLEEQPDGALLLDARLEVEDLADHLGVELPTELPEGRFETMGGLITTALGRVPKVGEEIVVGPLRMVIKEADERRVTKIMAALEQSPVAAASGD